MGRTAQSKLEDAARMDVMAAKLKSDPESAADLRNAARKIRKRAIKQLARQPRRGRHNGGSSVRRGIGEGSSSHLDLGL